MRPSTIFVPFINHTLISSALDCTTLDFLTPNFINNISVIKSQLVLFVEKAELPGKTHYITLFVDQLYHIRLNRVQLALSWLGVVLTLH